MKHQELSWMTPHRPARYRSPDWHWTIATIAVAVAVVAGYFGNILFGAIAVLSAFIIILENKRDRGNEKVTIVKKGILVGSTLYPVSSIHSFYINEDDPHPHLSLRLNKPLLPSLEIELGEMNARRLNDFLAKYIPEEEHEEHISSVIAKALNL